MNYMAIPGINKADKPKSIRKTPEYLLNVVCDYHHIRYSEIFKATRQRKYVIPRQRFFYLCWLYDCENTYSLSRRYGYNHATLIHARKVVMDEMNYNRQYHEEMQEIKNIIET